MTAPQAGSLPQEVHQVVRDLLPYGPERVILFGSMARGDSDEYSDMDFIVIKRTETRFVERLVEAAKLISLPGNVDVFVYTPEEVASMVEEENAFIESALRDGIVVYEKAG